MDHGDDPGRGQHGQAVLFGLEVVGGEVVDQVLLDIAERDRPGVVALLALIQAGRGEVLAAVAAVMEPDLVGANPPVIDLGLEGDIRAGDHPGERLIVAGLDIDETGVRRPGDIGQQRPPRRVEHVFRRQDHIEAEQDHHGGEGVERLRQIPLIDRRFHLHLGQVADGTGLQRPENRGR
ncbi:hypothetical protein [Tautonia marina]|uniref:hypothetical protein n=1 Tax=Tautonia marina TaxID=2653855 RepID=UPI00126092EB|nr:hypothetical protein [Tautonia marina]